MPPWFMPAGQYFEQATAMPILKRVRLCKLAIEQYQKAPEIGFGSPYRSLEAVKRRLQLSDRENIGSNRHPSPHPNPAQIAATASRFGNDSV